MSRTSNYRDLPGLNYSSIKVFKQDGLDVFHREIILGEKSKKKEDLEEKSAIIIGSLFDFIRVECEGDLGCFQQKLDEKFVLFDGVKSSSQVFLLADELYRLSKRELKEDGTFNTSFETRFREAVANMWEQDKFRGKSLEKVLELFQAEPSDKEREKNPDITSGEYYFQTKLSNIGKQTVDLYQLDIAKRLNQQTLEDEWVKDIFYSDLEYKPKFVIEFDIEGISQGGKIEIDITLWDHENKVVYPIDIKSIYSNRKSEIRRRYRKLLYGWQGAYYTMGLRKYLETNNLDYKIAPFEFVFFSTGVKTRPARLKMTEKMMDEALNGYDYEGIHYGGLLETIEDIRYHIDSNIWDSEREQIENQGYITI